MIRSILLRGLSFGEWVYLAALLVPLLVLNLSLGVLRWLGTEGGAISVVVSLGSEVVFNIGYALVFVGAFMWLRRGLARMALVGVFHLATLAVALVSAVSDFYMLATGAPLDYGFLTHYLANLGEARGAIAAETPLALWPVLVLALVYIAVGPAMIRRSILKRRAGNRRTRPEGPSASHSDLEREARPGTAGPGTPLDGRRSISRRRFITSVGGVISGAALVSGLVLYGRLSGASRAEAPVPRLLGSELRKQSVEEASSGVEVSNPLSGASLRPTSRTRRRHVALIHLESVRSRSVTPYEPMADTTPYLDELAASSLLVERAYSTLPHTSKALVSVNTGIYPHPATEILEAKPGGVPVPGLARLLGEQGYRSAWFQSAVGGFQDRPALVENFGYSHFEAVEQMRTDGFDQVNYLGYEDDVLLEPSMRWLTDNSGSSPTFVKYLGVTPHHDYQIPDRYGKRKFSSEEMLNRYLNNIRYDDFWTAQIIEQYKRLGLYEDTIFVIYGDHGEGFGEHGRYQHDSVIWEEGLRAPLMIHAPGLLEGNQIPGPANLMDIPPTIVKLLGYELEGGSYPGLPVTELRSRRAAERTLFAGCRPDSLSAARIQGHEKYIYHFENQPEESYDLRRDLLERDNLATHSPAKEFEKSRSEVLDWRAKAAALYEA